MFIHLKWILFKFNIQELMFCRLLFLYKKYRPAHCRSMKIKGDVFNYVISNRSNLITDYGFIIKGLYVFFVNLMWYLWKDINYFASVNSRVVFIFSPERYISILILSPILWLFFIKSISNIVEIGLSSNDVIISPIFNPDFSAGEFWPIFLI